MASALAGKGPIFGGLIITGWDIVKFTQRDSSPTLCCYRNFETRASRCMWSAYTIEPHAVNRTHNMSRGPMSHFSKSTHSAGTKQKFVFARKFVSH